MIFSQCLGRQPTERELAYLLAAHQDLVQIRMSESGTADAGEKSEEGQVDPQVAAMIAVARIVMNLDEFVTRD